VLKRVRDKVQNFKPQESVSYEEWEDIKSRNAVAKKFISEFNPIYILIQESLKNSEDMILENRIREVREIHKITDTFKKIFITSKKIQDDEIIGQIKFIRSLLAEVQFWIDRMESLEKREADGKAIIDRDGKRRS
jgi:hypothetical protein